MEKQQTERKWESQKSIIETTTKKTLQANYRLKHQSVHLQGHKEQNTRLELLHAATHIKMPVLKGFFFTRIFLYVILSMLTFRKTLRHTKDLRRKVKTPLLTYAASHWNAEAPVTPIWFPWRRASFLSSLIPAVWLFFLVDCISLQVQEFLSATTWAAHSSSKIHNANFNAFCFL